MASASKVALLTGITGQDAFYLAKRLVSLGNYTVHAIVRDSSSPASQLGNLRVDDPLNSLPDPQLPVQLHYAELQDFASLCRVIQRVRPDEVYNLGAQSQLDASAHLPVYTADVSGTGFLRLVEAVRLLGLADSCRILQPASATMLSTEQAEAGQGMDESARLHPKTHYALAKMLAFVLGRVYRQAYGMFVGQTIFFNHESPIRSEAFVSRKVTKAIARIAVGLQDRLQLWNFDSVIDWGYSADFMEAVHCIVSQGHNDDFVIATGQAHSVAELCQLAFRQAGIELVWRGHGPDEEGVDAASGRVLVEKSDEGKRQARAAGSGQKPVKKVGGISKAMRQLGWKPTTDFQTIISEMVAHDIALLTNKTKTSF